MKKVLFVLAMGCLVVTASAQTKLAHERMEAKATVDDQHLIHKVNAEPTLFMPQTTLVSNPVNLTVPSKTRKMNYGEKIECRPGRDIAENFAPEHTATFAKLYSVSIMPDSVITPVRHVHDHSGDSTYPLQQYHALGFVFDPYSYGWSSLQDKNFFNLKNDEDGFCAYRVDSLGFIMTYKMVTYDPLLPDSIIFYVSSHDIYALVDTPPQFRGPEKEYGSLYWPSRPDFGTVLSVVADTTGFYNEKGNHIRPRAYTNGANVTPSRSVRLAYALEPGDTTPGSYTALYSISLSSSERPDGFEVPAGHVVSAICEFKPGYTYNHGDSTLVIYQDKTIGDDHSIYNYQNNYFSLIYWGYPSSTTDSVAFQNSFWWFRGGKKGGGYNTSLVLDEKLRYNDTSETNRLGFIYSSNYYLCPATYLWVSLGDAECIDTTKGEEPGAIHNISDLLSSIYPNPASNKITVELKDGGKASIEVVNLLGQVVKAVAANDVKTSVDVSTLTSGIYIIRVRQNDKTQTVKFVKE